MFANLDFFSYLCNALARLTPTGSHILSNTCWITYGPLSDHCRAFIASWCTLYILRIYPVILNRPVYYERQLSDKTIDICG